MNKFVWFVFLLLETWTVSLEACDSTQIIAHRGASGLAPENTISAFQLAIDVGSDYIELDLRKSADDSLMVIHDATVNATTNGTGTVNSMTFAQLRALDAGSWFSAAYTGEQLPTLYECLQLAKLNNTAVCVEMKDAGMESSVVSLIQQMGMVDNVIIFSFSFSELQTIKQLNPLLKICWLDNNISQNEINNVAAIGGEYVGIGTIPTKTNIEYARNLQIEYLAWTVNDPDDMMQLMSKGIAGVITDDPHEMIALKTYKGWAQGGLRAHWSFDESGGVQVYDASGNENHLLLNGGIRNIGYLNNALSLNGSSDYAAVPATASLNITDDAVSISAWLKLDQLPSVLPGAFGPIYDSDQDAYILYLDKSAAELRFKVKDDDGDAERPGIPESLLSVGTWIHVVGTYNGDEAMIYLNGQLIDYHVNTSLDNLASGQQARIGENDGNYFDGAIDELKIYDRALSPSEVQFLFQHQLEPCLGDTLTHIMSLDANNQSVMTDTMLCDSSIVQYFAPDVPHVVYQFDGVKDYVDISSTAHYLAGKSHAFFCWIKTSNIGFDERIFAINGSQSGNNNTSLFGIVNGKIDVYNGTYFTGNTLVNDGAWHHIGYTWNHSNQQLQLWVDGTLDANFIANLTVSSTDIVSLGQEFDNYQISNQYKGELAGVTVWDTVFASPEVQYIQYNTIDAGNSSLYSNLIAQYHSITTCPGLLKSTAAYPTDGRSCPSLNYVLEHIPGYQSRGFSYQWSSSNTGFLSNADSLIYMVNSSQMLYFRMMDGPTLVWIDSAYLGLSSCTKLTNSEAKNTIQLFPNPASSKVQIRSSHLLQAIRVFNSTGQCILRRQLLGLEFILDVSDWQQGLYFVEIQTNKGSQLQTLTIYQR